MLTSRRWEQASQGICMTTTALSMVGDATLAIRGACLTRESGIRVGDGKVVARGVTEAVESTSCPCLAWLNQGYVSQVQIPAGCYFKKTHNPPHPVGREETQTDVGSLCHPGTTQATLADGWGRHRAHMAPLVASGIPPHSAPQAGRIHHCSLYTPLWTGSRRWPLQPQVGGFLGLLWTAGPGTVAVELLSFACGT